VPTQLIYRLRCPACGAWAHLLIAAGLPNQPDPTVATFDCPHSGYPGHSVPSDAKLLKLPGELIETIADYPIY
jgi:hypothetical protein